MRYIKVNKNQDMLDHIECVICEDDAGNRCIIPADTNNKDYIEYLKWLDEGNNPEEAE